MTNLKTQSKQDKEKSYRKMTGMRCHFHNDSQGDGKCIYDTPGMQPLCSPGHQ